MENLLKFLLNRYRLQVGVFLVTVIVVGGVALALTTNGSKTSEIEKIAGADSPVNGSSETTAKIKIDIAGAVVSPGVYDLSEGGRVEEALNMAGGLAEQADRDWVSKNLNLATKLKDGDKLYIPKVGETEPAAAAPASPIPQNVAGVVSEVETPGGESSNCSRVNINTASASTLADCLYNVAESRARSIIEYRESHGGFKSIEEIQEVSGIGPKTFEKIKDQITVD